MLSIGMLELPEGAEATSTDPARPMPVFANASKWVRAPEGGILRTTKRIGDAVSVGDVIGYVANPYEDADVPVHAPRRGLIIGRTTLPIVNMGDALFHIAWSDELTKKKSAAADRERLQATSDHLDEAAEPVLDEDEII
jgi:uncharacterized protein